MAVLGYDFTALTSTAAPATGLVFGTAIASPGFVSLTRKATAIGGAETPLTPTSGTVMFIEKAQGLYTLYFDADAAGGDCVALLDSGSANAAYRYISVPLNRDREYALPSAIPGAAGGFVLDPWATALPGAYGTGTAGNIVGTPLSAAALQASVSAALNAAPGSSLTAESIAECVVIARAVLSGKATISTDGKSVVFYRHDGVTPAVTRTFPASVITTPTLPETITTSA